MRQKISSRRECRAPRQIGTAGQINTAAFPFWRRSRRFSVTMRYFWRNYASAWRPGSCGKQSATFSSKWWAQLLPLFTCPIKAYKPLQTPDPPSISRSHPLAMQLLNRPSYCRSWLKLALLSLSLSLGCCSSPSPWCWRRTRSSSTIGSRRRRPSRRPARLSRLSPVSSRWVPCICAIAFIACRLCVQTPRVTTLVNVCTQARRMGCLGAKRARCHFGESGLISFSAAFRVSRDCPWGSWGVGAWEFRSIIASVILLMDSE